MQEARGSPPTLSAGVISSEAASTARPLGPPGLIERAAPALFLTFWSSGFVAAKLGLDGAEPITFLALRFVIVTALLLAIAVLLRRPWPRRPSEIGHLLVIGLVMQALYFGTAYLAFDSGVTAGGLALIVGMQPVATVILATWWLGERVRAPQIAGLALGRHGRRPGPRRKARRRPRHTCGHCAGRRVAARDHGRHALPEALLPRLRPLDRRHAAIRHRRHGHDHHRAPLRGQQHRLDAGLRRRAGLSRADQLDRRDRALEPDAPARRGRPGRLALLPRTARCRTRRLRHARRNAWPPGAARHGDRNGGRGTGHAPRSTNGRSAVRAAMADPAESQAPDQSLSSARRSPLRSAGPAPA